MASATWQKGETMAKEWIVPDADLGCDGAYFDYQELVRCKDCINYTRGKDEYGSCFENPMKLWRDTDYCSWAERRTDG